MLRCVWMCLAMMVALAAGGCVPERVAWSPDGTKGAIMGDHGLAVCDSAGKLTKVWLPGVRAMGWLPDSKRLVVVRDVELKTWRELAAAFPKEAVAAQARARVVRDALLHAGTAQDVIGLAKNLNIDDADASLAVIYLRDTEPATFTLAPTAVWKQMADTTIDTAVAQVYDVSGGTAKPGATVMYFLNANAYFEVRVSPTGKAVAFTKGRVADSENTEFSDVFVAAMDGTRSLKIEQCAFPDWTPNGLQLIYVRQAGTVGDGYLGTVAYRNIENAKGVVLDPKILGGEGVIGAMAYHAASRVRVTKDGVVYISGMPLTLPAMGADTDQKETVFWMDPHDPGKFKALPAKAQEALNEAGDMLAFFDVSPDGKLLSIPYKDGRVKLMELDTGYSYFIQPTALTTDGTLGLAMEPVWRTKDTVAYQRPGPDGKGFEVAEYSVFTREETVLSAGWGAKVGDWLVEKK